MDIIGTFSDFRGEILTFLLSALGFSTKRLYFRFIRNTNYGRNYAVKRIRKRLENKIKERVKDPQKDPRVKHSSPYGVENLFSLKEVSKLLPLPKEAPGQTEIINYIKKIVKNETDESWKNLVQALRVEASKNENIKKTPTDKEKVDKALKEFFKDLCETILKVTGRNADDTYKINALHRVLEESKYHEWLPTEFSSKLQLRELTSLESIRKDLDSAFKERFTDETDHIYVQIRDQIWCDQLLQTAAKQLMIKDYLPDSLVFLFSLFLQHAPITSDSFNGLEKYYRSIILDEFKDDVPRALKEEIDKYHLFEKVFDVCKASWNRQSFEELKNNYMDLALIAASLRIVNLATIYPADTCKIDEHKLQKRLHNIFKSSWKSIPNDIYLLCIAAVAKEVKMSSKERGLEIVPFKDIPEPFKYLDDAFESLLESELKFISDCVKKIPAAEEYFAKFLNDFKQVKKAEKPAEGEPKWIHIAGPALLAESGLQVLAHIDLSTASSSDIAERFAKGLIAVLLNDNEPDASVFRLIDLAKGLRSQLGRVHHIVELIKQGKQNKSKKEELAKNIIKYLEDIDKMRNGAVSKAVEELYGLKKPERPLVGFLFGYGKPLWGTIKELFAKINTEKYKENSREQEGAAQGNDIMKGKEEIKMVLVTAPLRPVGEGGEVKIITTFNSEFTGKTGVQAILVPDEGIYSVMDKGLSLDGTNKPAFCLMGCEAFDDKRNVINSAGCRTVAMLAENAGIRFYVVTESDKHIESVYSIERIASVDSSRFIDGRYSVEMAGDGNQWPIAEIVENKYITGIITDKGILSYKVTNDSKG